MDRFMLGMGVLAFVCSTAVGESRARADGPPKPVAGESHHPVRPVRPVMKSLHVGAGATSYWIFQGENPGPDHKAPVIVFTHGWLSINPAIYGAWIEHLVGRGFVVIYPRYQIDLTTPTNTFLPNAIAAVKDALDVLETAPGHTRPDRERFALMGHSAGGNLAAELAAVARESGLPTPKAVLSVLPGEVLPSEYPDLARIPDSTLLVVVAAEEDLVVGDSRARKIFRKATAVPLDRKEYVLLRSDRRGSPPLIADHTAPMAGLARIDSGDGPLRQAQLSRAVIDPMDTVQLWRLADATLDAAFAGRTLDESHAFASALRHPGRWSDGQPVRGPLFGDDLEALPRVVPSNGLRLIAWPTVPAVPPVPRLAKEPDTKRVK